MYSNRPSWSWENIRNYPQQTSSSMILSMFKKNLRKKRRQQMILLIFQIHLKKKLSKFTTPILMIVMILQNMKAKKLTLKHLIIVYTKQRSIIQIHLCSSFYLTKRRLKIIWMLLLRIWKTILSSLLQLMKHHLLIFLNFILSSIW